MLEFFQDDDDDVDNDEDADDDTAKFRIRVMYVSKNAITPETVNQPTVNF